MEIKAELDNTVMMIVLRKDGLELLSNGIVLLADVRMITVDEILPVDLQKPADQIVLEIEAHYTAYISPVLRYVMRRNTKPERHLAPRTQE